MWIINEWTINKALKNGGDNAYLMQGYNPIFMDESASHRFILTHDKDFVNLGSSRHMWLSGKKPLNAFSAPLICGGWFYGLKKW